MVDNRRRGGEVESVEVALTNSERVALVDIYDYGFVSTYKWRWAKARMPNGYALNGRLTMHNLIMRPPEGFEVDHVNGDGLDNRRCNLRLATRSQQGQNRQSSRYRDGLKGIRWWAKTRKWQARIKHGDRSVFLGYFDTAEQAATAYNIAALVVFGRHACLNQVNVPLVPSHMRYVTKLRIVPNIGVHGEKIAYTLDCGHSHLVNSGVWRSKKRKRVFCPTCKAATEAVK